MSLSTWFKINVTRQFVTLFYPYLRRIVFSTVHLEPDDFNYYNKNNASLFHLELKMGFLTILKKLRQKEKEMRILMLYPF